MTEQTITTPASEATNGVPGAIPMARRDGPRGLLPSTWTGRGVRIDYADASGKAQTIAGRLLDTYPAGPIVWANGARCLVSWDRLVLCELLDEG
jgi:hypothetical protein